MMEKKKQIKKLSTIAHANGNKGEKNDTSTGIIKHVVMKMILRCVEYFIQYYVRLETC